MNTQNLGIVSPVAMGDWQENFPYQKLNIVRHNGSSYIAKSENSGIEPGVESGWTAYWMLLNADVVGAQGPQGPTGEGVPTGGLTGQILSKNSNTNYDTKWVDPTPVSQTTGDSTTAVMSQKAVTDALTNATIPERSLQYPRMIPKSTRHIIEFITNERTVTFKPFYILNGSTRYDFDEQTLTYSITETINVITYNPDTNSLQVTGKANATNNEEWVLAVFNSNIVVSTGLVVTDCPYKINGIEYMPYNTKIGEEFDAKIAEARTAATAKLKVCSYNVGLYNNGVYVPGNTYDAYESIVSAYRQFLNDGAFDLVGTQEDTDIKNSIYADVYDRQLPNHVYDDNMYANIRTVYPIISQETGVLTDGSRGYSSATIFVNGKKIFVMSVHFGLDGDIQLANAAQILGMLEGHEYAVVFGDFNAGNGDVTAESLFANFTDAGYKLALGDYLPFKSTVRNSEVKFYDNIITTPNIIIQKVRIGDGEGLYSDHLPVFAELLIV